MTVVVLGLGSSPEFISVTECGAMLEKWIFLGKEVVYVVLHTWKVGFQYIEAYRSSILDYNYN